MTEKHGKYRGDVEKEKRNDRRERSGDEMEALKRG